MRRKHFVFKKYLGCSIHHYTKHGSGHECFICTHKSSICLLKCLSCDIKILRYIQALFIIFAIHNKHIVIIGKLRFSCKRSLFCEFFLSFFLLVITTFCHFECCLCCYIFCFNSDSSQRDVPFEHLIHYYIVQFIAFITSLA